MYYRVTKVMYKHKNLKQENTKWKGQSGSYWH